MELQYESHFVKIDNENVHIRRVFSGKGRPVIFVHGSIENGRIFYTNNGKGIAPYLASNGFDCYVADLPGRGLSTPSIGKGSNHDLIFYIERVIPAVIDFAKSTSANSSVSVVAHSWGGVITLATLAISFRADIGSLVFFGSKRRISIRSPKKRFMVDVVWRLLGKTLTQIYGYYPARQYKFGSDNETTESFLQTDKWVREKDWIYFKNSINIRQSLQRMTLPPLLSLTGAKDDVLGHPVDVKILLGETGAHQDNKFILVGKASGFKKDYDHINLLTDAEASREVFPLVLQWLQR